MCKYHKTVVHDAGTRPLHIHSWLPAAPTHYALVISHGMSEHIGRYDPFARFCAGNGIAVYGTNHRGHGEEAVERGHFSDTDGWRKVVDDLATVIGHVQQRGHQKVILFGHSMGSFVARQVAIDYGHLLTGLILCGSGYKSPLLCRSARVLAAGLIRLHGGRHSSRLIEWLSFAQFNRTVKNAQTPFDWTTRDAEQIRRSMADPLTGFFCTTQFWHDLMGGLIFINSPANVARMPPELPLLIISGDHDPVGDMGKGVVALEQLFLRSGMRRITMKLYPGARHELLNELNAREVFQDCYNWMQGVFRQE